MRLNRNTKMLADFSLLLAGVVWPANAQEKIERTLTSFTVITVIPVRAGQISDATSNITVLGTMTMKVDSSGTFTGDIMPAKDGNGNPLPAVVFRGSDLRPDFLAPQSLKVSGQINGHMIAFSVSPPDGTSNTLTLTETLPTIFGTGIATDDLSKMDSGLITGVMAGSATAHTINQDRVIDIRGGEVVVGDWQCEAAANNGKGIPIGRPPG